jgi:predicted deacylase
VNTAAHRCHDYPHLVRRWRKLARSARIEFKPFAQASGFDVYFARTRALGESGGLYVSAGIHGDEPASTEGLIAWAEANAGGLRDLPLLLLPCLNPFGLTHNRRMDEAGVDLNRCFHRDDIPVTAALRELLHGHFFDLSLNLHEDYDGQGVYLYEVQREKPYWGESLIAAASRHLPVDGRYRIDISTSRNGVIRRRFDAKRYRKLGGLPEAVYLQTHHARRAITVETPSEFDLSARVAAHVGVIEEAARLVAGGAVSVASSGAGR